jgi:DNA-binding transcriptional MerR regulator
MAKRGSGIGSRLNGAPAGFSGSGIPPGSPSIPDKLYFRIGEVAALCRVETYVLRFWQTEFGQLRPGKSGTGQRLYRMRDVEMALRIKRLLHDEGYTIAGAKGVLVEEASASARLRLQPELPLSASADATGDRAKARLKQVRGELRELLGLLDRKPAGRLDRAMPEMLFSEDARKPGSE